MMIMIVLQLRWEFKNNYPTTNAIRMEIKGETHFETTAVSDAIQLISQSPQCASQS